MEEISATNPKYVPAIVSLMAYINALILKKTILLASIHLFTKQILPSLCSESLTQTL